MQIVAINGAVISHIGWNVTIADLFAMFVADDVAKRTAVHALRPILRVPDDFIDKVAQMKHEAEPVLFSSALVFEDHSPVGVLGSMVGILAGDKGKAHWPSIVICRGCTGSPHSSAIAIFIREAIPVRARWFQTTSQHSASPVRGFGNRCLRSRNDPVEGFIFGDLDPEFIRKLFVWRTSRPQKNAVAVRIPGGDALRIEVAAFVPRNSGATCIGLPPSRSRA